MNLNLIFTHAIRNKIIRLFVIVLFILLVNQTGFFNQQNHYFYVGWMFLCAMIIQKLNQIALLKQSLLFMLIVIAVAKIITLFVPQWILSELLKASLAGISISLAT